MREFDEVGQVAWLCKWHCCMTIIERLPKHLLLSMKKKISSVWKMCQIYRFSSSWQFGQLDMTSTYKHTDWAQTFSSLTLHTLTDPFNVHSLTLTMWWHWRFCGRLWCLILLTKTRGPPKYIINHNSLTKKTRWCVVVFVLRAKLLLCCILRKKELQPNFPDWGLQWTSWTFLRTAGCWSVGWCFLYGFLQHISLKAFPEWLWACCLFPLDTSVVLV